MSHLTTVRMVMRHLDDVEVAAAVCGLRLKRDQTTHRWYQGLGRCEHALVLADAQPNEYEVGVVRAENGDGYRLQFDDYGGGRRLTDPMRRMPQEYSLAVAARRAGEQLARKGFVPTQRQTLPDGRVRLLLRRR